MRGDVLQTPRECAGIWAMPRLSYSPQACILGMGPLLIEDQDVVVQGS